MKNFIAICLFLFVISNVGVSQKKDFDVANLYYNQKAYQQAIAGYQRLLNDGFVTEEVYNNLGNSYYKNEQYGYAVLYYEKTLKLNPNNRNAKINLLLTQKKLKDKTEKAPEIILVKIWNKFIGLLSPNLWTQLLFLSIWLSFLCGIIFLYSKQAAYRRFFVSCSFVFLLVAGFTGFVSLMRYQAFKNVSQAIVTTTAIDVKNSPDANSNTVKVIYEGTKLKLEDRIGNWHKIKLEDGKTKGWIEHRSFEII